MAKYGISYESGTIISPDVRKMLWKWLKPAVDQSDGRYEMFDIIRAIESGTYKLWLVIELRTGEICGALVATITSYPRATYFTGQFIGGKDIRRWQKALIKVVRDYAILNGCVREDGFPLVEFSGRRGWERLLAPYGYEAVYTIYELIKEPRS